MDLLPFIQTHHLQNYIYIVIFFAMFADAAVTVFVTTFLISNKVLDGDIAIPVLVAGIYAEQLGFYYLGHHLARLKSLAYWANKIAGPFDRHLHARPFHVLLISKFIYGLHRAMLVRSGMLHLKFKKFAEFAVYISLIWLVIIGGLGFAFSASYDALKHYLHYAELIPLGLVFVFFFVEWRLSARLKKEL